MLAIAWSHNFEPKHQERIREFVESHFPTVKLIFRNPQFFNGPRDAERGDIIICHPGFPKIAETYKALAQDPDQKYSPQIIEDIKAAPKFRIVPVEEPTSEEHLEDADLGFVKKPVESAEAEVLEEGETSV